MEGGTIHDEGKGRRRREEGKGSTKHYFKVGYTKNKGSLKQLVAKCTMYPHSHRSHKWTIWSRLTIWHKNGSKHNGQSLLRVLYDIIFRLKIPHIIWSKEVDNLFSEYSEPNPKSLQQKFRRFSTQGYGIGQQVRRRITI